MSESSTGSNVVLNFISTTIGKCLEAEPKIKGLDPTVIDFNTMIASFQEECINLPFSIVIAFTGAGVMLPITRKIIRQLSSVNPPSDEELSEVGAIYLPTLWIEKYVADTMSEFEQYRDKNITPRYKPCWNLVSEGISQEIIKNCLRREAVTTMFKVILVTLRELGELKS